MSKEWKGQAPDISGPLQALGMTLPPGFSADHVAEAVGLEERLRTIDVLTQQPGPRLTLSA